MTEDHGDDPATALLREESDDHGIEEACYQFVGAYGRHVPTLVCACTACFHGETWEETGAELDAHLAEAEEEDALAGFAGVEVVG